MRAKTAMKEVGRVLQKAGPYVVLEVVMPGGTLLALLLYLHRTGQLRRFARRILGNAVLAAAARAFDQLAFTMMPLGAVGPRVPDGLEPLDFLGRPSR